MEWFYVLNLFEFQWLPVQRISERTYTLDLTVLTRVSWPRMTYGIWRHNQHIVLPMMRRPLLPLGRRILKHMVYYIAYSCVNWFYLILQIWQIYIEISNIFICNKWKRMVSSKNVFFIGVLLPLLKIAKFIIKPKLKLTKKK